MTTTKLVDTSERRHTWYTIHNAPTIRARFSDLEFVPTGMSVVWERLGTSPWRCNVEVSGPRQPAGSRAPLGADKGHLTLAKAPTPATSVNRYVPATEDMPDWALAAVDQTRPADA